MPVELELLPGQSSNSSGAAASEANFGNGLSQASQENSAQLLQGFAQMQNAVQASIAELTVLVKSLQASASPGDVISREGSALNLPPAVVPEGANGEIAPRKNQDEVLMLCERLFLDQGKIFDQVLDHRLNTQFQKIETVIANGRVPNGPPKTPDMPEKGLGIQPPDEPMPAGDSLRSAIPKLDLPVAEARKELEQPTVPAADSPLVSDEQPLVTDFKASADAPGQEEAIVVIEPQEGAGAILLAAEGAGATEESTLSEAQLQRQRELIAEFDGHKGVHPAPPSLLKESGICRRIGDARWFYILSVLMIVANAIYIGVEQDWNSAKVLTDADVGFQICEHIFCLFFVVELIIHFGAFKRTRDCVKDRWFLLDLFLVALIVLETWLLTLIMSFVSNPPNTGAIGGIGRMLRLLRLTRISKIMQMVPELVTMVKGMVAAIRAVHAALLILLLLVYVFAIIMNSLIGTEVGAAPYFASVRESMITLIVQGVFLDDISGLTRAVIAIPSGTGLVVLAVFILLSTLTVMNMLIGVLCQVVLDVSADEKETHVKSQMQKTLLVMLQDLDADNSGQLSKSEVQEVMHLPAAVEIMRNIQVDTQHLLSLTDMIYADEESTLPIQVIMNIVLSLRGARAPMMNDMAKSNNFLLWALETKLAHHRELMSKAMTQSSLSTADANSCMAQMVTNLQQYHKTLEEHTAKLDAHHRHMQHPELFQ